MPLIQFLSENPMLSLVQLALLCAAFAAVYLVFYATRDVLLRSESLAFQILCIVLTAALPIAGFFLYLLIRPAETLRQKKMRLTVEHIAHLQEKHEGKKK
jgi:TRAP-type C4-dicarboxylate transport system permease small subunit